MLGFILLTLALAVIRGDSFLPFLAEYLERVLRALKLIFSVWILAVCTRALVVGRRQGSPLAHLVSSVMGLALSARPLRYLYACLMLALFMSAFLYNKMLIPEMVPFQWDATFAQLDFALFGGRHPWEIMHPVLSHPAATLFLDIVYSSWVPMVFLFWAGALVSTRVPEPLRIRYWTATIASWVLIGLVMATFLSSAGPCFFSEIVPGSVDPYAELRAYLSDVSTMVPLGSALTKEHLWQSYIGQHSLPGGISAMPSMHNAQAALFVAFAYSIDRRLGRATLAYAALIFIGSVHLGWHYAIDGIVGIVAALAVWSVCGALLSRQGHGVVSRAAEALSCAGPAQLRGGNPDGRGS